MEAASRKLRRVGSETMKAAWYEMQGAAHDVLVVGEMPDPEPGPAEVRIRVAASGINPGDVPDFTGTSESSRDETLLTWEHRCREWKERNQSGR
jgi:hypothetical protein